MKKILSLIFLLALTLTFASCDKKSKEKTKTVVNPNCEIYPVSFDYPVEIENVSKYAGEVSADTAVPNGTIISPYYELTINNVTVPVYAARTANTVHSFAYIDIEKIDETKGINLNVVINLREKSSVLKNTRKEPSVVVLPLKTNVEAQIVENSIYATIDNYGSFSFVFNKKQDEALTLFVGKKVNTEELFNGKEIVYLEPKDYSQGTLANETKFTEQSKVYYFKKGNYKIDRISCPSNSIVYLESGAYLEIQGTLSGTAIYNVGRENIKFMGHGILDYSPCYGRGTISFENVNNIEFNGVMVINSSSWTLCMTACQNVSVSEILFLGYRTCSDGVMLSDCKHALVENNFIRTGDDAFETKSTSGGSYTEDVWFKNNAAWTDKAIAYGCVYEAAHDTSDVHFEDCSVGFALGNWSGHIGCCVIQLGNRKKAKTSNVTFNNIEVYMNYSPSLLTCYIGGSGGAGEGYGIIEDIYFSNIKCYFNVGYFLYLRTCDSQNCQIKTLYLDNIVANDVLLTSTNYTNSKNLYNGIVGNYSMKNIKVNTIIEGLEEEIE